MCPGAEEENQSCSGALQSLPCEGNSFLGTHSRPDHTWHSRGGLRSPLMPVPKAAPNPPTAVPAAPAVPPRAPPPPPGQGLPRGSGTRTNPAEVPAQHQQAQQPFHLTPKIPYPCDTGHQLAMHGNSQVKTQETAREGTGHGAAVTSPLAARGGRVSSFPTWLRACSALTTSSSQSLGTRRACGDQSPAVPGMSLLGLVLGAAADARQEHHHPHSFHLWLCLSPGLS